ncbi:MAG: NTP transferase domain-containing protein [Ignavibacteriales bacterium]|nr:NTP transferase domain-containing protein [Ignavibacteriales bacterium]
MPDSTKPTSLAVIIMAAGKGTRMKNPEKAKVMYEICGKPMVEYVVDLASKLQANRTLLVIGWQKQLVVEHFSKLNYQVEFVEQNEQLGTGHAILQTMEPLADFVGDVLVLSGDVPLLTEKTAKALIGYHRATEAVATILTAELDDPTGYGRIVHNEDGSVKKIVEHKDASKKELSIKEINSGIYVFDKEKLFECLPKIKPNNVQKEYYLTDVFELFWKNDWRVSAVKDIDAVEVMGINDPKQLEDAQNIMSVKATL